MLTPLSRVLLFVSSFAPLFVIWGLKAWSVPASALFFLLAGLGLFGTAAIVNASRADEGETDQMLEVEPRGGETAAYVATYILPFVTASALSWQDWLADVLFLVLLLVLYVTSNLIYVNPIVALFGLRLYRAKCRTAGNAWLLSRFELRPTRDVVVSRLASDVYVAIREVI